MSTKLKLTGLQSYTGRATILPNGESAIIKRGEVVLFKDEIAEKVIEGGRRNAEGDWLPYWQEVADDVTVNYNFTEEKVETVASDPRVLAEQMRMERQAPQRAKTLVRRRA